MHDTQQVDIRHVASRHDQVKHYGHKYNPLLTQHVQRSNSPAQASINLYAKGKGEMIIAILQMPLC